MKNILNRGFSGTPLNDFIAKAKFIIACLTGNAAFLTTDPTLADVAAQLLRLEQVAALKDPVAREAGINAERPILEQMLDDLADSLEKTANGNLTKLATTGFDRHADDTPTTSSPQPQNVRMKATGTSFEAQVLMDGTAGAKAIELETTGDPVNGPWVAYPLSFSSSRGIVIRPFPRAKDLWVRARTLGPNNTRSAWSDPATMLIP